ncbi:MAG: hypothetical protein V1837_03205 [Candidatus Woesearchaeota archaeon]
MYDIRNVNFQGKPQVHFVGLESKVSDPDRVKINSAFLQRGYGLEWVLVALHSKPSELMLIERKESEHIPRDPHHDVLEVSKRLGIPMVLKASYVEFYER